MRNRCWIEHTHSDSRKKQRKSSRSLIYLRKKIEHTQHTSQTTETTTSHTPSGTFTVSHSHGFEGMWEKNPENLKNILIFLKSDTIHTINPCAMLMTL